MLDYTQLEYIQGTGSQCVNTDIAVSSTQTVEIKFKMTEQTGYSIMGYYVNDADCVRLFNFGEQCYLDYGNGTSNRLFGGALATGTIYTLEIGNRYVKNLATGELIVSGTPVAAFVKTVSWYIFGNTSFSKGLVYWCKIRESGNLIQNLIPAQLKTGEIGMVDTVNNVFYGNEAGDTPFIAGPEVKPYDPQVSINNRFQQYLQALKYPFYKLCRLRFLNPDGSTAFALDNSPYNKRSKAFIQDGTINCNLQNGQRRQANVILSNLDAEFDYNINKVWFGQQIALDEGLILPDGTNFYLPQGVFYIENPTEGFVPGNRTAEYSLVDKWAYLDGTLFGNLDAIYEVPLNTNIFEAINSLLLLDRGNGQKVDNVLPVFTNYYNDKTTALPDGTSISMLLTPYTLRVDSESGTYGDVALGLSNMLAAWIGYDQTGALRVDPSQDDILDADKPILYAFTPEEVQFLGATYAVRNTEVYNDIIILGEALDNNPQACGRATNLDPASDTNIYTSLGKRTKREAAAGYYTNQQCEDLAVWKLKRMSVLQKSVSISCQQMFHIVENNLVTICRTDKAGSPIERHLITGFSRPLAQMGQMTINCTSVNDFPSATVTKWPA